MGAEKVNDRPLGKAPELAGPGRRDALSVMPSGAPISLGLGATFDHFIAYVIAGIVFGAGYGRRIGYFLLVAGLVLAAATLELTQIWLPGREAHWWDFSASAAGGVAGLWLAAIIGVASPPIRQNP